MKGEHHEAAGKRKASLPPKSSLIPETRKRSVLVYCVIIMLQHVVLL